MSRKLLSDPKLAILGKIMAKTAIFSWIFDICLTFIIDCGQIYVPNEEFWGSTGRPHIEDLAMNLYFTWGPTIHEWATGYD